MTSRILPVLALLVAVLIFFGFINPQWTGTIAQQKSAIAADDQALSAASEYTARQNELASARNAIDPANLARLMTFLPDSVDNVRLILDLDALAARSGLSLTSIDVANNSNTSTSGSQNGTAANSAKPASGPGALPAQGANPIGSVDLSLSASGSYGALKTFLQGIESSTRLLDVTDLTVKGSETGVYVYQMTVRLYWLR